MEQDQLTPSSRKFGQLRHLSRHQRVGLGAAAVVMLLGGFSSLWTRETDDLVPLPTETALTVDSVQELARGFQAAGLTEFQISGTTLLVPQSRLAEYRSVRSDATASSTQWATEWERQNERLTPFSSSRAHAATREIARAKLISARLSQLPDIQHADVVWDEDEQPRWGQPPKARATVYLMPHADRQLTLDIIHSVRRAVAGSKKNLDPVDVAVMDLARQVTYEGPLPVGPGDELAPLLQSLAEIYRREIEQNLSRFSVAPTVTNETTAANRPDDPAQGLGIEVTIDRPRLLAFVGAHPHDAADLLSAHAATLLRVTLTIPENSPLLQRDPEEVRRLLVGDVAAVTGIDDPAETQSNQIIVRFPSPAPPAQATAAPMAAWTGWSPKPSDGLALATVLLAIGGTILVLGRGILARGSSRSSTLPTFHNVTLFRQPASRESHESAFSSGNFPLADLDDLVHADGARLRALFGVATPRRWAVALRGSSLATRQVIAAKLHPSLAAELDRHCELLGPVTIGEIESSRQRILEAARSHPATRTTENSPSTADASTVGTSTHESSL